VRQPEARERFLVEARGSGPQPSEHLHDIRNRRI
jgi:hypothetical protein